MNFHKMQALGNDFCVFGSPNEKTTPSEDIISHICDRHYGIGCDCAVYIGHSEQADYYMHVFNPDGFEAEICGNALRCSAKYVYDSGYFKKRVLCVETKSGFKKITVRENKITTEIGKPHIEEKSILSIAGVALPFVAVSMGNPHCVIFVRNLSDEEFAFFGKSLEIHPHFPNGTNVEFANIINDATIEMRVWERGIGETLSCTTGSCACVAAGNALGYSFKTCKVVQPGGTITVSCDESSLMSVCGECTTVFKGTLL